MRAPRNAASDEEKRVTLHGNTRPEAKPENDRGPVHGKHPMDHMLLQLRRLSRNWPCSSSWKNYIRKAPQFSAVDFS